MRRGAVRRKTKTQIKEAEQAEKLRAAREQSTLAELTALKEKLALAEARIAFFQEDQERLINDGVRYRANNGQLLYTDAVQFVVDTATRARVSNENAGSFLVQSP